MRGGIRAFLLGAEPRERERSGGHRSWEGGTKTEVEEDGKDGPARGGGAGRGSSMDTVRGPGDRLERGQEGWRQVKEENDKSTKMADSMRKAVSQ